MHLNRSSGITHPAMLQTLEVYGKQQLNLPRSFSKIRLKLLCLHLRNLLQVEAMMNSRPLLPLETLPEDGGQPLTPSHFLMGNPTVSLPMEIPLPQASGMWRWWNQLQKIAEGYWQRWSSEYLRCLTRTPKWFDTRNFCVDDIVVCKDLPTQQPGRQLLARVTEIHPGSDGKVRVVTVSTEINNYARPSSKLALLYESSLTLLPGRIFQPASNWDHDYAF